MDNLRLKLILNLKWKLEESPYQQLEAELCLRLLLVKAVRQEFSWLLLYSTMTECLMTEASQSKHQRAA